MLTTIPRPIKAILILLLLAASLTAQAEEGVIVSEPASPVTNVLGFHALDGKFLYCLSNDKRSHRHQELYFGDGNGYAIVPALTEFVLYDVEFKSITDREIHIDYWIGKEGEYGLHYTSTISRRTLSFLTFMKSFEDGKEISSEMYQGTCEIHEGPATLEDLLATMSERKF